MTDLQIEPIPEVDGPFEPVGVVTDGLAAKMRLLQQQGDADDAARAVLPSDFQPEAQFSGVGLIAVPQATGTIPQIMARMVAWLETQVGVMMEKPPGSNHVQVWQDVYPAFDGEAWCVGLGVDAQCRQGIDFRPLIADVYYAPAWEQFAKDWGVWHWYGSGYSPNPGDPSLMGRNGIATHYGTAAPTSANYSGYRQIEGNTVAEGATGSQTNGIGTYVRYRGDFIRGWIDMRTLIQKLVNAGKLKIAAPAPAKTTTTTAPVVTTKPTSLPAVHTTTTGDNVALSDDDLKRIADAVFTKMMTTPFNRSGFQMGVVLERDYKTLPGVLAYLQKIDAKLEGK